MPRRKYKNNWKRNLALLGALATTTAAAAYARKNYKKKSTALLRSTEWPFLEEDIRPAYRFIEAEEETRPMRLKDWQNLVKLGYNPKMPPNPFDDKDPRNFTSWGNRQKTQ